MPFLIALLKKSGRFFHGQYQCFGSTITYFREKFETYEKDN
jgi:hypothetical protein